MGWTVYGAGERIADPQAECDRLCSWESEHSANRPLASALVGNVYYAAVEKRDKANGECMTFAVVFLIQRSPFGYKDMDESVGPCEDNPPLYVLEKLSPIPAPADPARDPWQYARNWRKRAWARFGGEPQGQQVELAL